MRPISVFASSAACAGARVYVGIGMLAFLLMSLIGYSAADVNDESKDNDQVHARSSEPEYISGQLKKDSAKEWSNRTRFGGDLRLRASGDRAGINNTQIAQSASTQTGDNPETSSKLEAVMPDRQSTKDHAETGIASLVELLKKKKVISAAEADRIVKQSANRQNGTASESEGIAALAALLESKKIIGSEEAARFTKQYADRNVETNENARIDKEEIRKDIREQVKQQVREELAGEDQVREKKQIQDIDNNMSYLTQKVAEMLYGGKVAELAAPAVPEWTKRVHINGDVRLRYEKDRFDKNNDDQLTQISQGTDTQQLRNTTNDADRFKYRVRLGATVDINDELKAVVRLSTGSTSNPVSTNSLLGDYMNKDNVLFDLAYLKWSPSEYLTLSGGRMPNPWFHSDLVWADDLNFEGLTLTAKKTMDESLTPFMTVGAFPLQQNDFSQHSKWLVAGQVGMEKKDTKGIGATFGAAYYYFSNITGVFNNTGTTGATDWSAPLFQQNGNTLFYIDPDNNNFRVGLASQFKELNLTGTLDVGYWDPVHIIVLGDYVKNLGFNKSDVIERAGPDITEKTTGYKIGLSVGYPIIEKFGQWNASLHYKYVGSDAVVDAFTDSDFHLGGTNAKGWILGTEFGLAKNVWLKLRWMTADQISGPPLAIDVLQLDLNARF